MPLIPAYPEDTPVGECVNPLLLPLSYELDGPKKTPEV